METNPEGSLSVKDRLAQQAEAFLVEEGDIPPREEPAPEEPETESPDGEEAQAEASNEAEAETVEEAQPEASDDEEYEEFELGEDLRLDVPKSVSEQLKELKEGNLRQADYTRKTQELSGLRKTLETREQELAQREAALAQHLQQVQPQEPDWQKLAEEDPMGWQLQKMEWDKQQSERQQLQRQYQHQQEHHRQQVIQQEAQKLVEKIPEWKDEAVYQKDFEGIAKVATGVYGYTPEEIESLIDHRAYAVLRDAMLYRQTKASVETAKAKVAEKPKLMKAGAAKAAQNPRKAKQRSLRVNLKKSGSVKDAAALLMSDME